MGDTFPLSKLRHKTDSHCVDEESKQPVFHATSPHTLVQAAGYLKHVRSPTKAVFFRGQTRLYDTLCPTLLRGLGNGIKLERRRKALQDFLSSLERDRAAMQAVRPELREPLLQHYGIHTTWTDVVDNIWVALWFACHIAKSVSRGPETYLHFERRIPDRGLRSVEYAYVLLLESAPPQRPAATPGLYRDERTETVDLRTAVPSHFVRPHAQHGVLVRTLSRTGQPTENHATMHAGTIRVRLADALHWLGSAATLTTHALFPPAYYDYGYQELLQSVKPEAALLGRIHRVQP